MKEIIKQVKKLEITTKKLVDGIISGQYHSVFKGQGIEFSEIREYYPGDDVRSIDWNVTARMNHPYVKEFIEERDLRVYFMFDISGSNDFGTTLSKKRKAIELTASLMFSALKNNDNIGLVLFSDHVEKFVPERKGKKHMFKLLDLLLTYNSKSKLTNIKNSLSFVSKIIKRKSLIFIISDFNNNDYETELKILKNKHDCIAINISDLRELEIPDIGLIQLEDEETGEQILVDTSNKTFRTNYKKIITEETNRIKKMFKKLKIDAINLRSDESYEIPIKKFFKYRLNKVTR